MCIFWFIENGAFGLLIETLTLVSLESKLEVDVHMLYGTLYLRLTMGFFPLPFSHKAKEKHTDGKVVNFQGGCGFFMAPKNIILA